MARLKEPSEGKMAKAKLPKYRHLDTASQAQERFRREREAGITQAQRRYERKRPKSQKYVNPLELVFKVSDYFYRQDIEGLPYTNSGLKRTVYANGSGYDRMRKGDFDYLAQEFYLGYLKDDDKVAMYKGRDELAIYVNEMCDTEEAQLLFSQILEHAELIIEEQREVRLYEKGRSADVYSTKAKDNWRDKSEEKESPMLIAQAEQALKFLDE